MNEHASARGGGWNFQALRSEAGGSRSQSQIAAKWMRSPGSGLSVWASLPNLLATWSRHSLFLATVLPLLTSGITVDSNFQANSFPTLQGAWQRPRAGRGPSPHKRSGVTGQPVTGESFSYLPLSFWFFQLEGPEFLLGAEVSPGSLQTGRTPPPHPNFPMSATGICAGVWGQLCSLGQTRGPSLGLVLLPS